MRASVWRVTKPIRGYAEIFLVAFVATRVAQDFVTDGWTGIDLEAAWSDAGGYLPWLFAGWLGGSVLLLGGERAWPRFRRAGAVSEERGAA